MSADHHHGPDDHHHHHDVERREEGAGPVGAGPAVLDIGGDIGALVATMDDGAAGIELFLRPDHDPTITVHTGVWERPVAGGLTTVAVFPALLAGTYHVLDERGMPVRTVDVDGGKVLSIDLRH